jgi:hypothetical protein
MNLRTTLLALCVAAAATPAVYADNFVGGELGYESHPATSRLTREQVRLDYLDFRAHPVLADGTVMLQGELGYVPAIQGAFADRVPAAPHSHVLGGNTGPSTAKAAPTDAERRAYRDQYIN